jgi:hypothetical protein
MMSNPSRAIIFGVLASIAMVAASTLAQAGGCCRIKANIGPVHVDTGHPLHPVTTDPVSVPGGTVKIPEPGPVPTTPSVQLDKQIPGAPIANRIDDAVHAPEKAAQKGFDAARKGIEHLGNEIGMIWARAKQKAVDMAYALLDQLIAFLKKHALVAAGLVFAAMVLAAAIVDYVPKAIAALFRRKRPTRHVRVRHA